MILDEREIREGTSGDVSEEDRWVEGKSGEFVRLALCDEFKGDEAEGEDIAGICGCGLDD